MQDMSTPFFRDGQARLGLGGTSTFTPRPKLRVPPRARHNQPSFPPPAVAIFTTTLVDYHAVNSEKTNNSVTEVGREMLKMTRKME